MIEAGFWRIWDAAQIKINLFRHFFKEIVNFKILSFQLKIKIHNFLIFVVLTA